MARKNRQINLPAPYLRKLWLDPTRIEDRKAYPYCLPFLSDDFEISFDKPITIIVGENGAGKSTLLEGIGALAGYDDAGGGKGYRPVDHSNSIEESGGQLSSALRRDLSKARSRGRRQRVARKNKMAAEPTTIRRPPGISQYKCDRNAPSPGEDHPTPAARARGITNAVPLRGTWRMLRAGHENG